MQRDFLEPGGFGAALGNDVGAAAPAIEPTRRVLRGVPRRGGMLVVHTREGHRPDLSDLPAGEARARAARRPASAIAGPMGRILVRGEPGHDIIPELAPDRRRAGGRQARQGRVLRHRPRGDAAQPRHRAALVCGVTTEVCVNTTVREANDRGFDCLVLEDCIGSYFPEFQQAGHRDDQGAGRDLRLGRAIRRAARRAGMNRRRHSMTARR